MSRSSLALGFALGALWAAGPARAQCTKPDFIDEVVDEQAGQNRCPPPDEPALAAIRARIDAAKAQAKDGAQVSAAYLDALRELREAYGFSDGWRAGLVRGIDAAITAGRDGKPPEQAFAAVRPWNPGVDPEACAFVVGTKGAADYACFVLQGEPLSPGAVPRMAVHVLDLPEATRAAAVLEAARSAIEGLQVKDIDKAIKRLSTALQHFDNLRKYGYLQYPWELAVDSALAPRKRYEECQATDSYCSGEAALEPASVRAIFLHPGVGLAAPGFGFEGSPTWDTAIALSLEVGGFVSYSDSFECYWGASLGAIVPDGDLGDTRFGLFLHATRWVHVGYLFSVLRDATRGDASVFVSMDLGSAFGASFIE